MLFRSEADKGDLMLDEIISKTTPGLEIPDRNRGMEDNENRSEERRVGKECRSRWSPEHEKKKQWKSDERQKTKMGKDKGKTKK